MNNIPIEPVPLPDHLLKALTELKKPGQRPRLITDKGNAEEKIEEGSRNDFLFREAIGQLHRGVAPDALRASVRAINRHQCHPPLADMEVDQLIENVLGYQSDHKVNHTQTDIGNADKFVESQRGEIKYCFSRKNWLIWNSRYWEEDGVKATNRRIVDWLKMLEATPLPTASDCDEEKRQNQLKKHIKRSQSKARIEAIEWISRFHPECATKHSFWDKDSKLINMRNGTYNLVTQTLQPHKKADNITHMLDFDYDASASCHTFRSFLSRIFDGDEATINFIIDMMGYSLLGEPVEQKAFFFHGGGANGKSTLAELIIGLHGSYGVAAQPTAFVHRSSERVRNDLARLAGKRFVCATEINDADRLDESLLKQVTGGDTLSARFLYGEYFNFRPQFVLVFTANNLPQIRGVDDGIWRRVVVIPFEVQIPEDEQDNHLGAKLRAEMSGIFNLTIEGLERYQRDGVRLPDSVIDATSDYRRDANKVRDFIGERCLIRSNARVLNSGFHKAYFEWARQKGHIPLPSKAIKLAMEKLGYPCRRSGGNNFYVGIDVKQEAERL